MLNLRAKQKLSNIGSEKKIDDNEKHKKADTFPSFLTIFSLKW